MAKEYEKRRKAEMERAAAGLPTEQKAARIRTVNDVVDPYLAGYKLSHRPKSILFAEGRLAHVKKALGMSCCLISPMSAYGVHSPAAGREGLGPHDQHGSGRTEPGHRAAVVSSVAEGAEAGRTQGRGPGASPKEQKALLDGLKDRRTPHLPTYIPLLLLTGMRAGEALSLTWAQVDLMGKTLTVGRAKTANGTGRIIPINDDLASILAAHRAWFLKEFGEPAPDHHLFPWGKPVPSDPTRHATDITWGWDELRKDTRSRAAFTTSGIPSPPSLLRTAFPSPPCSR